MEHLNKQQIVLLTLLTSFVASIATGITTVSLMNQAPASVSQTINRVVERTIQTVASSTTNSFTPVPVKTPSTPSVPTTVVVREEDQVVKAIEKIDNSIVRIQNKRTGAVLGIGTVVSADGIIATDAAIQDRFTKQFDAVYKGVIYPLTIIGRDDAHGLSFFQIPTDATTTAIALADALNIKSGQSIVAVSGPNQDVVSIGIISSIINDGGAIEGISTTIGETNLIAGTPLTSLDGNLIAIKAGKDKDGNDTIRTINQINEALSTISSK